MIPPISDPKSPLQRLQHVRTRCGLVVEDVKNIDILGADVHNNLVSAMTKRDMCS